MQHRLQVFISSAGNSPTEVSDSVALLHCQPSQLGFICGGESKPRMLLAQPSTFCKNPLGHNSFRQKLRAFSFYDALVQTLGSEILGRTSKQTKLAQELSGVQDSWRLGRDSEEVSDRLTLLLVVPGCLVTAGTGGSRLGLMNPCLNQDNKYISAHCIKCTKCTTGLKS